eukprot:CAMPEP_0172576346 /NCGR_PEP_ID=MMETSP1067-20121228/137674_1 /TAXON_ID=265564 ORGANISM="Thalassiosira punctigera, Strain Tpunct2005C2" /NCGR_SAMPLE_ID=MMETSP1067 /ASSEMBLY_ACC=CAM_ASM_000444 /LENGTH=387 /DNA_ID=CAMNT_0013369013 /DNA_START=243 /DNA_END=1407 /DNA_ORIENTATION=+
MIERLLPVKYHALVKEHRGKRYLVYYLIWILVGTLCFAYAPWSHTSGLVLGYYSAVNVGYSIGWAWPPQPDETKLLFVLGYYSAVNVGYSIGWAWPPQPDGPELLFSSVYLLFGSGFISLALGVYAEYAMKDRDSWFTKLLKQQEYEEAFSRASESGSHRYNWYLKARLYYDHNKDVIIPVSLWLTWLFMMMMNGRYAVGFSWPTTQYYALTSCSTGGMVGMVDAPLWSFFLHAFLTSMAVPWMAWAMAAVGMSLTRGGVEELEKTKDELKLKESVTPEELEFIRSLGLEDGDGQVDKAKFIILYMVRMGVDVQLLNFISKRFEELDNDQSGALSIREITGGKFYMDKTGSIQKSVTQSMTPEEGELQENFVENTVAQDGGGSISSC